MKLKMLSPENVHEKAFYEELLHIIGMSIKVVDGRSYIIRKDEGERHRASLLEMVIQQLDSKVVFYRVEHYARFGENYQEQLYHIGLHLMTTWISRLLFLKLLEDQLLKLHQGNSDYRILSPQKIKTFHDLDRLFFDILSIKPADRSNNAPGCFAKIPYINSILFEPTDLEQQAVFISNLGDGGKLPIIHNTVLKTAKGKKRTGSLSTLEYLLSLLHAYTFSVEGKQDEQDNSAWIDARSISYFIDAIIHHKEGLAFNMPAIAYQLLRQSIHRTILDKFNTLKGWSSPSIDELKDKLFDKTEANLIIDQVRICDPAVGAGTILALALNEIIVIKAKLGILSDLDGVPLTEYTIDVVEGELLVLNREGKRFEYQLGNTESLRVQQALFHEKARIIQNCLFGVDCRLLAVNSRLSLWIELVKNIYYSPSAPLAELSSPVCYVNSSELNESFQEEKAEKQLQMQPLPNIDLNFKCGNPLISRFPLGADLRQAYKGSRFSINEYQQAVKAYQSAATKEQRAKVRHHLDEIKADLATELAKYDPKLVRLQQLNGELYVLLNHIDAGEVGEDEMQARKDYIAALYLEIDKLSVAMSEAETNPCYESAFEWRLEFPQLLNEEGSFVGFDLILSRPPLYNTISGPLQAALLFRLSHYEEKAPLHACFLELGLKLLRPGGELCMLLPDRWVEEAQESKLVQWIKKHTLQIISTADDQGANQLTGCLCIIQNSKAL